jgi:hypothetical protein
MPHIAYYRNCESKLEMGDRWKRSRRSIGVVTGFRAALEARRCALGPHLDAWQA